MSKEALQKDPVVVLLFLSGPDTLLLRTALLPAETIFLVYSPLLRAPASPAKLQTLAFIGLDSHAALVSAAHHCKFNWSSEEHADC